jgi:hypothetical protein
VSLVGWCIEIFYNSRLVPKKNYKENFCGFLSKRFPRKYFVPCFVVNRSHT